MKAKIKKLDVLCVSLAISVLMFTCLSDATMDLENIAAVWLFDEGSGVRAGDSTGLRNDGEIKNGAKWVKGKFGSALEFDGTDDYVEVGDSDILNITDEITIVAWVKPTGNNAANYVPILQRQQASSENVDTYYFGFNSNYRLHFGTYGGNTQSTQVTWNDGQWYHVAATYRATGLEGYLYINGTEEKLSVDNCETMAGGANEIYMGRWKTEYLSGAIDEIGIFNVVLTEDDIKEIMVSGLGKVTGLAAVLSTGKLTTTWGGIRAEH